jgi:hypothetical protein
MGNLRKSRSTPARIPTASATGARAGVEKVSVSLAAEDAAWAREQALSRHLSVSAVVSDALRRQRQIAALGRLLSSLGPKLSAGEIAALRAELYEAP